MGFPSYYYKRFPPEQAYRHLEAFIAAKQVFFYFYFFKFLFFCIHFLIHYSIIEKKKIFIFIQQSKKQKKRLHLQMGRQKIFKLMELRRVMGQSFFVLMILMLFAKWKL